jgi:hypothetical protein
MPWRLPPIMNGLFAPDTYLRVVSGASMTQGQDAPAAFFDSAFLTILIFMTFLLICRL